MPNLFTDIPSQLPEELQQILLQGSNFTLERIVSRGHQSAPGFWYEQTQHEWVLLISGQAQLRFAEGNRLLELSAGDYLLIPAGEKHRVESTSQDPEAIWLCLFFD